MAQGSVTHTILLVDDSDSTRAEMRKVLEAARLELSVIEAQNGADALKMCLEREVDVVVSDIVMPQLDGLELLRALRQRFDPEILPVILVTSVDDMDTRGDSFVAGVNDYLTKPFAPVELVSRVQVQLRLRALQGELRRTTERFRKLGSHDELTGLANRRHIWELCKRELSRSRRHRFALALCVLDVDGFKAINQRVGHLVGDAIIADVAELMGRGLRQDDVLARLQDEKFAALLPQTDAPQARIVTERIREAVRAHAFVQHRAGEVTVSAGVACYPGRLEAVEELVNAAETCLARAKAMGGNRVEVWADEGGP